MNSFFQELKRRNVFKIAVSYAVVGWLLIQVATQTLPFFEIPNWVIRLVIVIVIVGFPISLIVAWAFQLTPQGIRRDEFATAGAPRPQGGHTWIYIVIAGCFLSVGLFFLGRYTASRTTSVEDDFGKSFAAYLGKSIAVLPFENRSEDKANAYFADGIQDEILTRLAKIGELKVISRTSTMRYKSSPENLSEIARQLGVEHVLEGSVQKAGENVRVTVQLIRGATDTHVWAETYDRKLGDILAVESEIAETIAGALKATLTPHEQKAVAAKPTDNPAAYEEYLRGLALWNKATSLPGDADEIVRHFSSAVELDPKFALGWSFLSVAHSNSYAELDSTESRAAKAKEALDKALGLDPDLGEARFAQGMYRYKVERNYDGALEAFQLARDHSANRAMAVEFSAYVKRRQGKWDDVLYLHGQSLLLDPRNPTILAEVALSYRALRRFAEAQALIDRAREIEPENTQLICQKAEMAFAAGDSDTTGRLLKDVKVDGDDPFVTMVCVRYRAMKREFADAIRELKKVIEAPGALPDDLNLIAVNYRAELAILEKLAGNPDATAILEKSKKELIAARAESGDINWTNGMLLMVAGFLKDKATVDSIAEHVQAKIKSDAMSASPLNDAITVARAHLGETDVALKNLKQLLQTPGENSITPALLRADPLWDPLRNDPRFRELAEEKR